MCTTEYHTKLVKGSIQTMEKTKETKTAEFETWKQNLSSRIKKRKKFEIFIDPMQSSMKISM